MFVHSGLFQGSHSLAQGPHSLAQSGCSLDDEETLTAYHEAGHAVIGYVLGGRIESICLGGESGDDLPRRFGDCRVNWGPVDARADWQLQREILTLLAGPTAEMIYRGEKLHPAVFGPWTEDWRLAFERGERIDVDPRRRTRALEFLIVALHDWMKSDECWAAIAAVADQLLAHEFLEEDALADTLAFWIG